MSPSSWTRSLNKKVVTYTQQIFCYASLNIPVITFCSLSFSFNFSLHFPFHFRNIVFFIYFHFFLILLWSKKGLKTQLFRCIKHCFHRWKMKSFSSLNLWYSKILITHTSYDAMDQLHFHKNVNMSLQQSSECGLQATGSLWSWPGTWCLV